MASGGLFLSKDNSYVEETGKVQMHSVLQFHFYVFNYFLEWF